MNSKIENMQFILQLKISSFYGILCLESASIVFFYYCITTKNKIDYSELILNKRPHDSCLHLKNVQHVKIHSMDHFDCNPS